MEKKIRVSPKLKLKGKARVERSHDLHFAGYDFTSGPRGTTIHRQYLGAPASSGKSTFKL